MPPPGPDSDEIQYITDFLDAVCPVQRMIDLNGDLLPSVGARLQFRLRYQSFFRCEIRAERANGQFLYYTTKTEKEWSDADIKKFVVEEAGAILVPHALETCSLHRWNGVQYVFDSSAVFSGTLNMLSVCVPLWLGRKVTQKPEHALTALLDAGYQHRRWELLEPIDTTVQNDEKGSEPLNPTAEYYAKKRSDSMQLADSEPCGLLIATAIMNRGMESGLKRKLYIAGERWDESNNMHTAASGNRRYRIVEDASNSTEAHALGRTLTLFQNESAWKALPQSMRTVSMRSFCTRTILKQVGSVVINLVRVHDDNPHLMFLLNEKGSRKERLAFSELCTCLRDDTADYWFTEYPGDKFASDECHDLLQIQADAIKTASTSSECGHSMWQAVCRARSLQTVPDSLQYVSATSFLRQNKRLEKPIEAVAEAKKLGRPPKPTIKKRRKGNTNASNRRKAIPRKYQQPPTQLGWWGPYRVFVSENFQKGVLGKAQFAGLSSKYNSIRGTAEHARLVEKSRRLAHQRAMGLSKKPTRVGHCMLDFALCDSTSDAGDQRRLGSEVQCTALQAFNKAVDLMPPPRHFVKQRLTEIRCSIREVGMKCRANRRFAQKNFLKWMEDQTDTLQHGVFNTSVGVNGVSVMPGPPGLTRVHWRMPAIEASKALLKAAGEPRTWVETDHAMVGEEKRFSPHDKLRQSWTERHKMFVSDRQKNLDHVKANSFRRSLSRKLGFCVCEHEVLLLYRGAFLTVLRGLFLKSPENPWRLPSEANAIVLRLEWKQVDDPTDASPKKVPLTRQKVVYRSWSCLFFCMGPDRSWRCVLFLVIYFYS